MFGQDRDTLRQYYHAVWQKWQKQQPLSALEQQIAVVIQEHPEYHTALADADNRQQEYFVETGASNPYLHMGLHLAIREQVATTGHYCDNSSDQPFHQFGSSVGIK